MTDTRTYLDWNATAPLLAEARAAMLVALDRTGNASSVHAEGQSARSIVETARERVAALLHANARDIVLTSGGTEANNMVLAAGWETIIVSAIEHESVLAPARASGARVVIVGADADGIADIGAMSDAILCGPGRPERTLVCLQIANNETGVLQPVSELTALARAYGVRVHCDAVQGAGRLSLDVADLDVDYASISGHKLGAPQGIGALYVRAGAELSALLVGGGQERGRRAGTENVAAAAGFGAAADLALRRLETPAPLRLVEGDFAAAGGGAAALSVRELRERLERGVSAATPDARIIGARVPRLPNTSCLSLPGRTSETLVIALDLAGFAVSAGAACSSGKVGRSHVLDAMGLEPEIADATIRVSLGSSTTADEIDLFLTAWARAGRGAAMNQTTTNNEKRRA